jgi:uncharacterized membrane protein YeaQ/YmgE (transglycosylase-associated protein family)
MGLTLNGQPIAVIQIVVWLLVALVCGAIAESILGYTHIGLLGSTGVGLIGALAGSWLASALHLPSLIVLSIAGVNVELVWALLGSILLVLIGSTFRYRRTRYY